MPTYEYRCAKCGEDLEVYQTFSEEPLKKHAVCGGKLTRVFSPVGIVLKGSGFYKTDKRESSAARGKAREETSSNGDSSTSSSDSKGSDSKTSESKTSESKGSESRSSSDSSKSAPASEKKSGEPKRDGKKSPVKSG